MQDICVASMSMGTRMDHFFKGVALSKITDVLFEATPLEIQQCTG